MKKILIINVVLVMIFTLSMCGCSKKETKVKSVKKEKVVQNKEKDVVKNQKIENFKMTNTSLKYDGGYSTLETDVKNISNETNYLKSFDIIVKDKSGKEMIKLVGYIGEEISAGETKKIISKTDMDLLKAGSVEYTINR